MAALLFAHRGGMGVVTRRPQTTSGARRRHRRLPLVGLFSILTAPERYRSNPLPPLTRVLAGLPYRVRQQRFEITGAGRHHDDRGAGRASW